MPTHKDILSKAQYFTIFGFQKYQLPPTFCVGVLKIFTSRRKYCSLALLRLFSWFFRKSFFHSWF